MHTRSQLRRRRSFLARAWDLHIPAICDKRPTNAERAGVRTEIVASWERSAAYIMPEVAEAPLADLDETRNAFQTSPLSWICSAAPAGGDLPTAYLTRFTISPLTEEGRYDAHHRPGSGPVIAAAIIRLGPGRPPPSVSGAAE